MVKSIEVSKLNPIRLRLESDQALYSDCYRQSTYYQKYNSTDMTNLQILTPTQFEVKSAYFIDNKGLYVRDIPFTYYDGIDGVLAWDFLINFSQLGSGNFQIKIIVSLPDSECVLISDKICVGDHDCTVLINYTNDENVQSVVFNTGIQFFMRVDGGFIPTSLTPDSNDVMYIDQMVNHTIIRSVPFVSRKITFGGAHGIPDWMGEILNCIFSCNNIAIENKIFTKKDAAKWELSQYDSYDLRSWSLELIEVDQSTYTACELIECSGEFSGFVEQILFRVMGADRVTPIAISRGSDQLILV